MAYKGPCIQCGNENSSRYTTKLCNACYKKLHYIPKARKKYTGPCVICGISNPEFTGRFTNKMCYACRSRMRTTGNAEPRQKYNGPCVQCGTYQSKNFYKGSLCRSCYRKSIYVKKPSKFCIDCSKEIWTGTRSPRCKNCTHKYKWRTNPEYKAGFQKRAKTYSKTLKGRITQQNHVRRYRAIMAGVKATLTTQEWQEIIEKFDYRCAYCHKRTKLEVDHVIPISKGGNHTADNVVPACRSCNASKCDKILSH